MNPKLESATLEFQQWMTQQALPLWVNTGFDHQAGCVYEQLLSDGTPDLATHKRMRVQARQIFVFATATQRGWLNNGQTRVAQIVQFLNRYALHPEQPAVYVQNLSAKHQQLDAIQDIYDVSFYLLSCAARFSAFKDESAIVQANEIMAHLNSQLKSPYGGWQEGNYCTKARRQNPHMHLLEAFMALFEATNQRYWLELATDMFDLFNQHFYDAKRQVVLEYFADNWAPHTAQQGQSVEPGHMLEWVWLLYRYHKITGMQVTQYTNALYQSALAIGQEHASGLIYDECNLDGKPVRKSKRCWPITELIKASLAVASMGHKEAETTAADGIDTLFRHYLCSLVSGSYCDQLDENNRVINNFAPASTLYHLMVAVTESIDYTKSH